MSLEVSGRLVHTIVVVLCFACSCVAQTKSAKTVLQSLKNTVNSECDSQREKYDTMSDDFERKLTEGADNKNTMSTALKISAEIKKRELERVQVCLDTTELLQQAETAHEVLLLKKSMLMRFRNNMKNYNEMLQSYAAQN